MNKYKVMLVHWRDASSKTNWHSAKDGRTIYYVDSIGYKTGETKEDITLSLNVCFGENTDTDEHDVSDSITIPKGCIIKKRYIKI